jgi:ABC-type bacteriocin/lantibiotic exporters, contain an N-terminal double-glycine peptidase domain
MLGSNGRMPLILQTEAAECGLACLAMISSYFGCHTDLTHLRAHHDISLKGTSLNVLIDIASRQNLSARPVRVELESLSHLHLPAILHWNFNHFVVLHKIRGDKLEIFDPAQGRKWMSSTEVSQHFTGVALELSPTSDFKKETRQESLRLWPLLRNIIGLKKSLGQVFLLAISLQVFALISPFFMQLVVDMAVVSEDVNFLTTLGLGFLLLALIQALVTATRAWVVMLLGNAVDYHLQRSLFRHLLLLPMRFFERRHMGDVISRFDSLNQIQNAFTQHFVEALVDGLLVFLTLVMMFFYSGTLTGLVLGAALLYGIVRVIFYHPLKAASEQQIVRGAKKQSYFLESLKAMQSVKVFGVESSRQSRYNNLLADHYNSGMQVQRLGIIYQLFNGLIFGCENVAVIWLGGLAILNGNMSVGMLFAFMAYKRQFISRTTALIDRLVDLKMLSLHLERVADIALHPAESMEGALLPRQALTLEFENVAFRHSEGEAMLFRDVNLLLQPGEHLAVVGPSGVGKSTLLKIALGLLTPVEGRVKLAGVDFRSLDKHACRRLVCAVTQEDQLVAGSIKDNILFGAEEIDLEHMDACAAVAAIHQEILALPMGYNTLIGDMGMVLSSGQKQRVLLARALYRRPQLLILDEATSHLDLANEKRVIQAIKKLGITQIVVAHRPHTIASAERVVRLTPEGCKEISPEEAINTPLVAAAR